MSKNLTDYYTGLTNPITFSNTSQNENVSENKSASRRGRGLFNSLQGSQSSPNARITRIQANPLQRIPPRFGPNTQMLQSGSSNSLRNVIKNDVFTKILLKNIRNLFIFFALIRQISIS